MYCCDVPQVDHFSRYQAPMDSDDEDDNMRDQQQQQQMEASGSGECAICFQFVVLQIHPADIHCPIHNPSG
jgi:hypothetical protein